MGATSNARRVGLLRRDLGHLLPERAKLGTIRPLGTERRKGTNLRKEAFCTRGKCWASFPLSDDLQVPR